MGQRLLSAILCCSRWRVSGTYQEEGSRNRSARTAQETSLRTFEAEPCEHTGSGDCLHTQAWHPSVLRAFRQQFTKTGDNKQLRDDNPSQSS